MARVYQQGDEPVKGYRLIRFLGRGGCGEVWQAQGPGGTEVAFKIISFGEKSKGKDGSTPLHELEFIKRTRHPNLVPIIALWLCDGKENQTDLQKDPPSPPGLRAHTLSEIRLTGMQGARLAWNSSSGAHWLHRRCSAGIGLFGKP
jgi:serine/threonine protein kinase